MRCSKCGTNNPTTNNFCAKCGSALTKLCAKCKAENPPTSDFCGQCGAPLTSSASPVLATSSPPESASGIRVTPENSDASLVIEGERKTVTALFADIKGSTELEQDLDPEEARAIVDPALKLMIDAARRYDGYIVQSTGDGIFGLFGAPVAHEDHPQRALFAALRMQEELRRYGAKLQADGRAPIEIRVGVNTGEVVVRSITTGAAQVEYTPIGHTTNLASRLQSIARTGSIVASEATRKFCEGYFILKPLGATKVKGVSEPVGVYEVTGLGPLRTRLQRSAGRGLTKFVGRQREMDAMKAAAEQAKAGHGQIVAAIAEAGVGKSRLFFEFKAKNQSGWMVLETFSVSHGKASAYLPVIELLWNYFKINSDDDERARREKVTGRVLALERTLEDTLPYLFALLAIVEGDDLLTQMDGQIKKRRTLDAIKRIMLRESLNQPLMVVFEDLHWIDDETQALLNLLADSIPNSKILMLVNYRPEYSHQWGSKTYYTQLRLDPLGEENADEMLTAMVGDAVEIRSLKHLIIERTQGNPFFMEETVQVLLDEGALVREGIAVRLTKQLSGLKIPPTVQGILAARIDRLPADEKDLLQALAVMGKEFKLSLVRVVNGKSDDELNRMLGNLQLGEFIYEQPAVGDTEYVFKHALTQEVAYNSVLIGRRKQLHERIGVSIESLYTDSLDDHLSELAHHFPRGGDTDKAVKYLTLSGTQSLARYAYAEAQTRLRESLRLIEKLPESPERDLRELAVASALVDAEWRVYVHAGEALARAASLAEKIGNIAELIRLLNLQRVLTSRTGEFHRAAALADRILELAEREGSAISFACAYHATHLARLFEGNLAGAEEQFANWRKYQAAPGIEALKEVSPVTLGTAAVCAWMMGRVDLARERIAEATAFAVALKEPFTLMVAKWMEAVLYRHLREAEPLLTAVSQCMAIREENGIRDVTGIVDLKAWALARLGKVAEGLSLLSDVIADGETKTGSFFINARFNLSEVQVAAGMYDLAMESIQEALSPENLDESLKPELLRVRGDIRTALEQRDAAEADFREAIALTQKMSAKMLELRATVSLARLLRDTNRRDEARAMLADIYGWFTEGFDTHDLKDAKALLDELNA